jgi:hypothetical protein
MGMGVGSVSDASPDDHVAAPGEKGAAGFVSLSSVRKRIHFAEERAGFRDDGGISINQARPSQLADVATYRPHDADGEVRGDTEGIGITTTVVLPGDLEVMLYKPRHRCAL